MKSLFQLAGIALAVSVAALPQSAPPVNPMASAFGNLGASWTEARDNFIKKMETKPSSIKAIPSETKLEGAKREVVRWGPFTLIAANATNRSPIALDAGGNPFFGILGGICRDCMFLYGRSYLTFEDGRPADIADGVYNHHVAVSASGIKSKVPFKCKLGETPKITVNGTDLPPGSAITAPEDKPKGFTDPSQILNELSKYPELTKYLQSQMDKFSGDVEGGLLFGSGDDGSPQDFASKDPSLKAGLYIPSNATVSHYTEITNYKDYPQTIYITADLEYIPGRPAGFKDAFMSAIAATGCGGVGFFPPAGSTQKITSPPWMVSKAGFIYNGRAHLHDGGVSIELFKNGNLVCTSEAIYGGAEQASATVNGKVWETIQGYKFCTKPVEVQPGDILRVESNYDLKKHPLRPGTGHGMSAEAMGLLGVSFAV